MIVKERKISLLIALASNEFIRVIWAVFLLDKGAFSNHNA